MGWGGVGMPPRISYERFERNARDLRDLVNSGSPSVVRAEVDTSRSGGFDRVRPIPSIGCRVGKITVTGYVLGARGGLKALIVKCDCGFPEYTLDQHNFKEFKTTRCFKCARKAGATKRYWNYVSSMSDDDHRARLLNRLCAAITRCHVSSSKSYKSYGARGITVCDEWRSDKGEFLKYVQTLEGWDIPEYDMDRRDNSKGYEPRNIRFISRSDNNRNKRKVDDLEDEITRLRLELSRYKK